MVEIATSMNPLSEWEVKVTLGLVCLAFLALYFVASALAHADVRTGTASYYTVASCRREGTSGIMANGRKLKDEDFTAASWNYRLGTALTVCPRDSTHCVHVTVTDRGPNRILYKSGRILDLSQAAFRALAPLKEGVIAVTVEEVR